MLTFERQSGPGPTFYYRSNSVKDREFDSDIVQVWCEVCRRIREHRQSGTWNRLIFECWYSEGRIVAYPHMRGDSPDDRRPAIDVAISIQEDLRQKLAESEGEAEIRSLAALTYSRMRGPIRDMYRREPALSEFKSILKDNDFTCWTTKNDDLETLMKIDIFF
jgi:hypothetical protein